MQRRTFLACGASLTISACAVVTKAASDHRDLTAAQLYPPPNRVTKVGTAKVYADQRGAGQDVVLLHGASGNGRDFTFRLADMIAEKGYRVTSFDRPGLGWSDNIEGAESPLVQADHLIKAAKQMGVKNPIVLGYSYGGAVALAWALIAREKLLGLVSLSGASHPWPGGNGLYYGLSASIIGEAIIAPSVAAFGNRRLAQRVLNGIFAPAPVPHGYLEHIGVEMSLRKAAFMNNARQVAGLKPYLQRMQPRYEQLRLPVEILYGQHDTIVPPDIHGKQLAQDIVDARLTMIAGAGHAPHHSHPNAVIQAIQRLS